MRWFFFQRVCSCCSINTCYGARNNNNNSWAPYAAKQKHKNNSLRQANVSDQRSPRQHCLSKSSRRRLMWNKANSQWTCIVLFHLLAEHTRTHSGSNTAVVSCLNEQFWVSNKTDPSGNLEEWWSLQLIKQKALKRRIIIWSGGDQRTWKENVFSSRWTYSIRTVFGSSQHVNMVEYGENFLSSIMQLFTLPPLLTHSILLCITLGSGQISHHSTENHSPPIAKAGCYVFVSAFNLSQPNMHVIT